MLWAASTVIGIHISVGSCTWFNYNDLYILLSVFPVLVLIQSAFAEHLFIKVDKLFAYYHNCSLFQTLISV